MIATLLALALTASAQDPDTANRREAVDNSSVPDWAVQTYTTPYTGLEVGCARQTPGQDGCLYVQFIAGGSAGVTLNFKDSPGWFGEVRIAGELRQALAPQGTGLEARLGSFWGIDQPAYRVTMGPDFIANMYEGQSFLLRPGIGLGWMTQGVLKLHNDFWIQASVQPAVFFGQTRKVDAVPVIDELIYRAGAQYRGRFSIEAGWVWRRNAGGIQQGAYIGGSF